MTDQTSVVIRIGLLLAFSLAYYLVKRAWISRRAKANSEKLESSQIASELFTAQLLEEAKGYCSTVQNETINNFGLEKMDRYHVDQEKGTLVFFENDVPKVQAHIQILGTHSKNSGSWMWSICNESISDKCVEHLDLVWNTLDELAGEWYKIDTVSKVRDTFIEDAVALSVFLSNAKGWYCASNQNSNLYIIMTDIQEV